MSITLIMLLMLANAFCLGYYKLYIILISSTVIIGLQTSIHKYIYVCMYKSECMSFMYFYTIHPIAIKFCEIVEYTFAKICIKKNFEKSTKKSEIYIL